MNLVTASCLEGQKKEVNLLIPRDMGHVKSTVVLWASATLIPVSHDRSLLMKFQKLASPDHSKFTFN